MTPINRSLMLCTIDDLLDVPTIGKYPSPRRLALLLEIFAFIRIPYYRNSLYKVSFH